MSGPSPAPLPSLRPSMSRALFRSFQHLIHAEAGLFFRPEKEPLIAARLGRRMRALGVAGYGPYLERVKADAAELQEMLEAVCTGHTQFFREPVHFDLLTRELAPRWKAERAARPVRVWSAACSTGEEPYSLAMALADALGAPSAVNVLASDLSLAALERARRGCWPRAKLAEVPRRYWRFVERSSHSDAFQVGAELRACVRWAQVNLSRPRAPVCGPFDLIFCRNVLIYFDAAGRAAVIDRLARLLAPGGHLVLGLTEALVTPVAGLERVGPSVYQAVPR